MEEIIFYWKKCFLENFANFKGRARRKEYWYFVLVNICISIIISILGKIFGFWVRTIISILFSLAILVPGLAVGVRRLHDIGKSGWFWLLALIPFIGIIILIIFAAQEGENCDNQYGPNPKA